MFLFCNCSLCGFQDALTFKTADDDIINKVEQFIKNDLCSTLTKLGVSLEPNMNSIFFGKMYECNPADFQFLLGERKQIDEMAKHVQHTSSSDNQGVHLFYKTISAAKYMKGTIIVPNLGRMFSNDAIQNEYVICEKELSAKLYGELVELYHKLSLCEKSIKIFDSHMVKIDKNNGVITGIVKCILCEQATSDKSNKKDKPKEFKIYSRSSGSSFNFNLRSIF